MDKVTVKYIFINEDFYNTMCIFNIFLNKDSNGPNSTITQIVHKSLL